VSSAKRSAPLSGLFVAGTDTGVGKTVVSCGLLRLASRLGLELRPYKPAESGCVRGRPADAHALRLAAQLPHLPIAAVCPFPLRPPVAPAAATPPGRPLQLRALIEGARRLSLSDGAARPILVEAAGGLLSPYARSFTAADLASALALPTLLVARNGLGTINHTALAVAELRRRRIPLLGIVLVTTAPPGRDLRRQQNAALIAALTGVTPALVLPFLAKPEPDVVADLLARSGSGRRLFRAANLRS
jgi:dethiobiotin synthetase